MIEGESGLNPLTPDTDGDGGTDGQDAFPAEASETLDTDGDGIGNNADIDDDGDKIADADLDPLDATVPPHCLWGATIGENAMAVVHKLTQPWLLLLDIEHHVGFNATSMV